MNLLCDLRLFIFFLHFLKPVDLFEVFLCLSNLFLSLQKKLKGWVCFFFKILRFVDKLKIFKAL